MKRNYILIFIIVSIAYIPIINASTNKLNYIEKYNTGKFFDFTDFVLEILEDIINKNVTNFNLNDDCLIQLKKWNESLENNDEWAIKGLFYEIII